jgi:hypothetical protein
MGCCANKCCCADSQKNHNLPSPPPLAKDSGGNHELIAVVAATATNLITFSEPLDIVFVSSAGLIVTSAPRPEILCTFLI